MKRFAFIVPALILVALSIGVGGAAPPYDRQVSYSNPPTYSDGTPIPATDNLVGHIFVCTSSTDNATCTEVGQTAFNVASWSGTTLLQPVDATRFWRVRVESKAHNATGAYSPVTSFFLQGTAAPGAAGAPAVQ